MLIYPETLFWLRADQSLLVLLNAPADLSHSGLAAFPFHHRGGQIPECVNTSELYTKCCSILFVFLKHHLMFLTYFPKPLTLNTYSFKQEHEEDMTIIQHTILQIYDKEENECIWHHSRVECDHSQLPLMSDIE